MTTSEPTVCPFLVGETGDWRSERPNGAHRCHAVTPPAALAIDKQRRLCLSVGHVSCSTYVAALEVRAAHVAGPGPAESADGGRWGYARQVLVVDSAAVGPGSVVRDLLERRPPWQLVPAAVLVVVVGILGASGLGGGGTAVVSPTPTATPTSTQAPTATPTSTPAPTAAPTATPAPTPTVTPSPVPTPAPSYQTYTVKSGDTLYAIARRFGVTVTAITDLNGITRDKILHSGDVLLIPNP